MYASAQYLDFLDLAKNCSFPNQKLAGHSVKAQPVSRPLWRRAS